MFKYIMRYHTETVFGRDNKQCDACQSRGRCSSLLSALKDVAGVWDPGTSSAEAPHTPGRGISPSVRTSVTLIRTCVAPLTRRCASITHHGTSPQTRGKRLTWPSDEPIQALIMTQEGLLALMLRSRTRPLKSQQEKVMLLGHM